MCVWHKFRLKGKSKTVVYQWERMVSLIRYLGHHPSSHSTLNGDTTATNPPIAIQFCVIKKKFLFFFLSFTSRWCVIHTFSIHRFFVWGCWCWHFDKLRTSCSAIYRCASLFRERFERCPRCRWTKRNKLRFWTCLHV